MKFFYRKQKLNGRNRDGVGIELKSDENGNIFEKIYQPNKTIRKLADINVKSNIRAFRIRVHPNK